MLDVRNVARRPKGRNRQSMALISSPFTMRFPNGIGRKRSRALYLSRAIKSFNRLLTIAFNSSLTLIMSLCEHLVLYEHNAVWMMEGWLHHYFNRNFWLTRITRFATHTAAAAHPPFRSMISWRKTRPCY